MTTAEELITMTASPDTLTAIYNGISNLDADQIPLVIDALRDQQMVLRRRAHREVASKLAVGSKVRIARAKPQYLQGHTGEVTSLADGKVSVKLDHGPLRKFTSGTVIFRSAGSLEVL